MKPAQMAVIVNPASANGTTARRWPEIAVLMKQEGLEFREYITTGPGDATWMARQALEEGCDLVVSVGGDGTANEVINGFFSVPEPVRAKAAVAFISMGTGGDLVKTLGIPKDPQQAVRHLLQTPRRLVDVGRVTYIGHKGEREIRYFINIAGLGLDGDTVARVNRTSKALGGFISFLWGTVVSLLLYRNLPMTVTVDGKPACRGPLTLVVIGNGRFFGGGMCIAPQAEMDDGLFDIILLNNMNKITLLANLPKVYRGTHLSHPKVMSLRGRKVTVHSSGKALLDLDGEQPGQAPAEIEILPLALQVQG